MVIKDNDALSPQVGFDPRQGRWQFNPTNIEVTRGEPVVFGQVVGIHVDDSIIKDGRIDTLAFKPVARLGYSEYTTTENVWKMRRPDDPSYQ